MNTKKYVIHIRLDEKEMLKLEELTGTTQTRSDYIRKKILKM